jgi:hypothetical protein
LAIVNTTTTVSTSVSTQLGQQLVVSSQANTVTVGNFVTDVTLQPYIANRIISFYAYNMRPNQRIHVFFDSVLVDEWCRPGTKYPGENYITNITNTSDPNSIEGDGPWGTAIYADLFGQVGGQFSVPAGVFRTGERVLELADVTSLARGSDSITTVASASFTASNMTVSKQTLTMTTINPSLSWSPLVNTFTTTSTATNVIQIAPDFSAVYGNWNEPIAQALTINTPNKEAGIFVTSLELYFQQKSISTPKNGVTVYLCETNNGYPDGSKILPFSTVHLNDADINVSGNATVPTKFVFESPVFLSNGLIYAFIVKPDANDPDIRAYSALLGDMDLTNPNVQVSQQPAVGTAFEGATMTQWTTLNTEYIKFKLNRAAFSAPQGNAIFKNANTDFLNIYNITYSSASAGILPGDYVFESNTNLAASANTSRKGIVEYFDSTKDILYVANSTSNFSNNAINAIQIHRFANTSLASTPNSSTMIAYANLAAGLYDMKLNVLVPQFATIAPPGTTLTFKYSGTSNSYAIETAEYQVNLGTETEFLDQERIVASASNKQNTLTMKAHMTTDSEFLSPVVDMVRNQQLVIGNDIDPVGFNYDEFFNSGASKTKYISQVITLATSQDSQDLQVVLDAFRPPKTDIQVWVKFMNGEDTDTISSKVWTPLINKSGSLYSNPTNPRDFREFTFYTPEYYGPIPISSSATVSAGPGSAIVTGSGDNVFRSSLKVGWYVNMLPNSTFNESARKIVSINATSEQITLESPFDGTHDNEGIFIVAPPTTPWLSTNTEIALNGQISTSSTNNTVTAYNTIVVANTTMIDNANDTILISSANTYYKTGDRVFYTVPTGNTAIDGLSGNNWYYVTYSNTSAIKLGIAAAGPNLAITALTTNPGQNHTLAKCNFLLETDVNSVIKVGDDSQRIISISNSISLSIEKPWQSDVTFSNAVITSPTGVTYLNSSGTLYTTYKQFQIKVILQSNDSSQVPVIDDLRALALQI